MGFENVKAKQIVDVGLALLTRDTLLASTVWRDSRLADFRDTEGDTITIKLPAYAVASKRTLRANQTRQRSTLIERKVDLKLDTGFNVDVPLTDEQLRLDVTNLTKDVTAPSVQAIIRGFDEDIASLMHSSDYETEIAWGASPYETLVDARTALNDASVPSTDRFLVIGSGLENELLKDDHLSDASRSGSSEAFRAASPGQIAGFNVLVSPFLDPEVGFAYHRTAYAMASVAPLVPQGVAWGASQIHNGFAIRVMQHLTQDDQKDLINMAFHDAWCGLTAVTDNGHIDANGKFIPSVDPTDGDENDLLVRAVKIGTTASA